MALTQMPPRFKAGLSVAVASLATVLFTVILPLTLYVEGALFGAVIAIALQKIGVFDQRQAGWFIAVSTLAYYLCLALVLKVGVFTPNADSHSSTPLILAGCVGGLLVVSGALLLLRPAPRIHVILVGASCGAACGALLSAVGLALAPSLGLVVSKLLYNLPLHLSHESDPLNRYSLQSFYALSLVWQTGMGFVLGLMLSHRQGATDVNDTASFEVNR